VQSRTRCAHCDQPLPQPARPDRLYCTARCRRAAEKRRRREERQLIRVITSRPAPIHIDPNELSTGQRMYVAEFEARLRTPEGIDICLQIAEGIGITLERRNKRGLP
jgi:hypothetical protein